jgi:acetaldehyde dehydrogenase (acetylating)
MTLGCGGWGGNITSDNITPKHLLNIKRLAYELRPAVADASRLKPAPTSDGQYVGAGFSRPALGPALPQAPARPVATGISVDTLASRIDQFLASRGYTAPEGQISVDVQPRAEVLGTPADFVCEDDVRAALKAGQKLVVGEKTIITPSARDLGESEKVFVQAGWPR